MTGTWVVRYLDLDGTPTATVAGNRACEAFFPSLKAAAAFSDGWMARGGLVFEIEHLEEQPVELTEPKPGDRVRVTYETTIQKRRGDKDWWYFGQGFHGAGFPEVKNHRFEVIGDQR